MTKVTAQLSISLDDTRRSDVADGSMRKLQDLGRDGPNAATNLPFRTTYEN